MTLQDLIDFLDDQQQIQTLTRQQIERCLLLAYEMGREHMREELHSNSLIPYRIRAGNSNLVEEAQRGS